MSQNFADWSSAMAARAERALDERLPAESAAPVNLHRAMRYAVLGGGKRVRPLLVYAAGELAGAPLPVCDCAAAAVEFIHAYSLVHDDLPCMDDDVLRRGKPTVHVAFGEATAMLVGDALQALAFESAAAAHSAGARAPAVAAMTLALARAAGSLGMAGGQAIDLEAVGQPMTMEQLRQMHERKTGAMLRVSVLMGAALGRELDAPEQQLLQTYGDAIGLAFQVVDDILDVASDSSTLGKTAGKDAMQNKPTYVSTMGMDASRRLADDLCRKAHESVQPFGAAARRLHELADLIVLRKS